VFLFVWYFFILTNSGIADYLITNSDTHGTEFPFMFLLLALFPMLDSQNYNKNSILLASFIGLFMGLSFSLTYLSSPVIFSFFIVQIFLITKYFFIDKNKFNVYIIKNYFFLFIFFILGIIPWIYLGVKTNFANLTYRGGPLTARNINLNPWEGLLRILSNNGILDKGPLWFTLIFYFSLMVGLVYVIRLCIEGMTKKKNHKMIRYDDSLLTYTVLALIIFIVLSSQSRFTSASHPLFLTSFIPAIIFIVSIVLIKLARIFKDRFLGNRNLTSKRLLFNLLNLLLTVFIVILFIRLAGTTFQIKGFSSFPSKYYTSYENFFYRVGLQSFRQVPSYWESGRDICSQLDNKFYKKHCFEPLLHFPYREGDYLYFDSLDDETKEWIFAYGIYFFFWQKESNNWQNNTWNLDFFKHFNINNKEEIIKTFKTRGVCADLYSHEHYDKEMIYDYIEKNNLDREQCIAGVCMIKVFEPWGMYQFSLWLRRDKKERGEGINRMIEEYGSACKTGIEFYEEDFRAFYNESLINDSY